MTDLLVALLKRLPFVLALAGLMVWTSGLGGDGGMVGAFAATLMTLGVFITICIIIAPPIAAFLAEPFASIYMPKGEVVPPPLYFLVEKHEQEGRIEEAMAEYAKILRYHPEEYPAHLGRIHLAVHAQRDIEAARRFYCRALATLSHPQARIDLEAAWREMFPKGEI